jgi:subtilase family serine protease
MCHRLTKVAFNLLFFLLLAGRFTTPALGQMVPLTQDEPKLSAADLANASPAPSDMQIKLTIDFKIRNLAAFNALINNDPTSPLYGKNLPQSQLHALFGARPADYQAVEQWLQANGFTIESEVYGLGALDSITVTGSIAQVEQAFGTNIVVTSANPLTYSNTSAPSVPVSFASAIDSILGIDSSYPPPPPVPGGKKTRPRSAGALRN